MPAEPRSLNMCDRTHTSDEPHVRGHWRPFAADVSAAGSQLGSRRMDQSQACREIVPVVMPALVSWRSQTRCKDQILTIE
jgi:hypothetical protein